MANLCLAGSVTNGVMCAHGRLMLWCERRKPFQDSMLTSKTAIFKLRKELRSAIKTLTVAEEALVEVDSVVAGCVRVRACVAACLCSPSLQTPTLYTLHAASSLQADGFIPDDWFRDSLCALPCARRVPTSRSGVVPCFLGSPESCRLTSAGTTWR